MDAFVEKLVAKKKKPIDYAISFAIIAGGFVVAAAAFMYLGGLLQTFVFPVAVAIIYFAYRLNQQNNIEFEYIVTNGSLDIDKIIAQRKRQRIFSSDCKDFEVLAKVKSPNYGKHIESIPKKINAVSAGDPDGEYFIVLSYKGVRTVVYFEPNERMLDNFRRFIPRKMLN